MKKALVIGVIFLFLGLSVFQPAIAKEDNTNIVKSKIMEDSNYHDVVSYVICLIYGTYKTKTSDDFWRLILDSGKNNRTMTITGASVYYDDLWSPKYPQWGYHTIHVWKVKAWRFFGIAFKGFVLGIGIVVNFEPDPCRVPVNTGDKREI